MEVTTMEKAFYSCKGLTELDISSFANINKCKNYKNIFDECNGLTVIIDSEKLPDILEFIPDYVTIITKDALFDF